MVDGQALLPCSAGSARRCREPSRSTPTRTSARTIPTATAALAHELVAQLELIDAQAFVFPMHEPDGYPAANDMVLAEAAASDGRLFAFCRLDPGASAAAEARRCLEAGARGIKLHPRAEGFNLDHPRARTTSSRSPTSTGCRSSATPAAASRRSAATPIEVCSRYPGLRLILAHAGISRPLLDLARGARPPEPVLRHRLVVAERPAGAVRARPPGPDPDGERRALRTPAFGATMALRHGLQVGLAPDVLREISGGQARRLVEREDTARPRARARHRSRCRATRCSSASTRSCMSAIGQMFAGVDPQETLALAALACDVGDAATRPAPAGLHGDPGAARRARALRARPATAGPAASPRAST